VKSEGSNFTFRAIYMLWSGTASILSEGSSGVGRIDSDSHQQPLVPLQIWQCWTTGVGCLGVSSESVQLVSEVGGCWVALSTKDCRESVKHCP